MFKKILFLTLLIYFGINFYQSSLVYGFYGKHIKVEATQIIDVIKRGEGVMLDSCTIVGPVRVVDSRDHTDTIKSFILIARSSFQDSVMFNKCIFLQPVSFRGCVFGDDVYFGKISFRVNTTFDNVVFENHVTFDSTFFDGLTDFENANFHDETYFTESIFERDVLFRHVFFEKPACFFGDSFKAYTDFGQSFFNSTANFWRSKFSGQTFFTDITFNEDIVLTDAEFSNDVSFFLAKFKNIYVRWYQLKGFLRYDAAFISNLVKNFEELRRLDDADETYLFLKDHERITKYWFSRYLEFWFIQQTCGYGVKPLRPLATSFVVVILFTTLYFIFALQEKGIPLPNSGSKRFWKKLWNAFYYSINTFIVGIPANWKVENKPKDFFAFRVLTTTERTFGWILLAVFVVTLTRKFIR